MRCLTLDIIKKLKYRDKLKELYYKNCIYRNKYINGNTIVVFGNGIDLYSCLKTSFADFYSSPEFKKIKKENNIYSDKKEWNDLEGTLYLRHIEENGDLEYSFLYKNFAEVKRALVRYLLTQEEEFEKSKIGRSENILYLLNSLKSMDGIINFNYTDTIEKIYNFTKLPINYIHGSLKEYRNDDIDIVLGVSKDINSINVVEGGIKFSKEIQREFMNFERFCKMRGLNNTYYNFTENKKEYIFFLTILMGIYSLDYQCMGDKEGFYFDAWNKDKADESAGEWVEKYASLVGMKAKKITKKLVFDCNKLRRRYIYDNNYHKWVKKHSYCVKKLAKQIRRYVKKDNDLRRACSDGFKAIVIDYFEANNFVPMRIKIKSGKTAKEILNKDTDVLDIDKVAKIIVVGHSFSTYNLEKENKRYVEKAKKSVNMRIGSSDDFLYDDFIDDQEIFIDLFSGKKLEEIDYYNYWDKSGNIEDNIYNIENERFQIKRLAKPNVNIKICTYGPLSTNLK